MTTTNTIKVKMVVCVDEKTQGDVILELHPEWAPIGVERFVALVKDDFMTECRFHRVIPNFVCQFGISGDPEQYAKWARQKLKDDDVKVSNKRGTMSFATSGPNARSTQLFINLVDNQGLDSQGFSPIAKVIEGMDLVDKLYSGYNDSNNKPNQLNAKQFGNEYLIKNFPKLSYVVSAKIL
mmetsp:Transcript_28132/g.49588  ORF Transcript_28132/g.49588 Transcript_28132/m.49588 type:complete len:181 (+) Transcript_28132:257-799(+)|eukprot:CAMPEP_0197519526 /NCGR_PEP_ID=MMETSP1318-20131121/4795_1 /TAXON_ID=552666 /ORGANISM="Partenskyella glossopodia, Strain RCC365" /LENGTH=180 /DNA_ID=CAMNT_0043070551 /DNA_START=275 /DNA_END=817 /DNA_ORIENTATION=-